MPVLPKRNQRKRNPWRPLSSAPKGEKHVVGRQFQRMIPFRGKNGTSCVHRSQGDMHMHFQRSDASCAGHHGRIGQRSLGKPSFDTETILRKNNFINGEIGACCFGKRVRGTRRIFEMPGCCRHISVGWTGAVFRPEGGRTRHRSCNDGSTTHKREE